MFKNIIFFIFFLLSNKSFSSDLGDYIQYGAGYYSSIAIHELGHASAAKYFGAKNISIEVPQKGTYFSGVTRYEISSDTSRLRQRIISISGLVAGNLANEIVIQTNGLHSNAFAQGIASTAHITNVANVFNYYTRIRGQNGWYGNDIDEYELSGGNPHVLSTILIGYTVWSLKRMSDKNIPLFGFEYKF